MNEELRIIIRAVTDEAKKNLAGVREELGKIKEESKQSGKAVDVAMRSVAKGMAIAVGAVAALTTAMVALTKRSMEFQKAYGQLISGFQASGSTIEQANQTYKELFSFLGEADRATEASNLLVKMTNNSEDLAEWTNILKGVYATFPDSLPVETLAESANETARVGKVTGTLADALNWAGVSEDAFNAKLATTNSLAEREAMIRGTLNSLYGGAAALYTRNNQALLAYNESQAKLDIALANATRYVIPLMTQLNNLAATLLQILKPAFETVSAVVIVFVQWIIAAIQYIGSFFGLFGEEGTKATEAVNNNVSAIKNNVSGLTSGTTGLGDAFNQAADAAKELKKQTMGFDELNVVSSQTSASTGGYASGGGAGGGGVSGGGIDIPSIEEMDLSVPGMDEFQEKVEKIKAQLKPILILIGLIGGGLLLWKIADFVGELMACRKAAGMINGLLAKYGAETFEKAFGKSAQTMLDEVKGKYDGLIGKLKLFGGLVMIAAGAILLIKGYSDAWVNGVDWGNFATILGGIGLIVGGIALAFGPLAAAIATVVGGIALVVLGVKDFIENGYSMQNVIMIAIGAILILVGAIWAFNAALLANPITWIVIAIMALVAAFVILWNECEGFRNFWIGLWEKAKQLFSQFVNSIQPLIDALVFAFQQAWELIKVIWNDYLVPLFQGAWERIKFIWDAVKPYFQMIWDNIKRIFSIVGDILGGYFRSAWEIIKAIWSVVVSYFTTLVKNIGLAFSVVKNLLTGNFSEAWEGVKKIFANVGSFFKGVVNTVTGAFKNIASIVGDTISSVVKKAINGVLSNAVKIINGFISAINFAIEIINAIPGVNIKTLGKLEVPKLATGGITTGATMALIGEQGQEAVLPLENNTGWMDVLADRIAARQNTASKIVLMVDGRELGWASIDGINSITKQTGSLQLRMV